MPSDVVVRWLAEVRPVLKSAEAATCLYHALFARSGVMTHPVVLRQLPRLQEVVATEDEQDFADFLVGCFPSSPAEATDERALLLRALYSWRTHGALQDVTKSSWAHINDTFLDGELPTPDEYCQNDAEGMLAVMSDLAEMWSAGEAPLWAGICVTFGSFVNPTALWHYCEMRDIHDFYTDEYISALAAHITSLGPAAATIVEVGAGRGGLTKRLAPKLPSSTVVATDMDSFAGVEQLGYEAALQKYSPTLVLCAWMPYGCDWTPDFRRSASVRAYIQMGPPPLTGTTEAWMCPEGWTARHVEEAEMFSICKLDSNLDPGNTKTISYLRK